MIEQTDINGTSTAYQVVGNGPPLLLLHGGEGGMAMFDTLYPLLADSFKVILYDQRESGDTTGPVRTDAGLALLADDAQSLLHRLGFDKAHAFGTSFGGRVGQMLAIQYPEAVDKLVLGSTWPLPESLDPSARERLIRLRQGLPATAEELAAQFIDPEHLETHPHLKNRFRAVNPNTDRSVRRSRIVSDVRAADLTKILAPTLLLAGDRDKVVNPEFTMGMARWIPHSTQVLLPGVGHSTSLQAPALVAAQLKLFLLGKTGQM